MLSHPLFASGALIVIGCEEPTHFGTGRAIGLVDLPIQRSSKTDLPIGQSGSVRGTFRSFLELRGKESLAEELFGPSPERGVPLTAGHLSFSDAKLLAMPVRSLVGLFCWVTSPWCLWELRRAINRLDYVGVKVSNPVPEDLIKVEVKEGEALIPQDSENVVDNKLILMDEAELTPKSNEKVTVFANNLLNLVAFDDEYLKAKFKRRLAVVRDDDFKYLTKRGLEVATRIGLTRETKTVRGGALWSEEYLPAMSILFCEVYFHPRRMTSEQASEVNKFREFLSEINGRRMFIGGKESVGRGLIYVRVVGP